MRVPENSPLRNPDHPLSRSLSRHPESFRCYWWRRDSQHEGVSASNWFPRGVSWPRSHQQPPCWWSALWECTTSAASINSANQGCNTTTIQGCHPASACRSFSLIPEFNFYFFRFSLVWLTSLFLFGSPTVTEFWWQNNDLTLIFLSFIFLQSSGCGDKTLI